MTTASKNKLTTAETLAILVVIAVALLFIFEDRPEKPARPPTHQEIIAQQFSSWDGSHRGLERVVKAAMKNPGSFDHVSTTYRDQGVTLLVRMVYRGTNSFGAVVTEHVSAIVDLHGNVLEILPK